MEKQRQIAEVIQALSDSNNGVVTPAMVFNHAKDPTSPLHDQYEWDKDKAAYRDWMNTSRRLIRSVKVEIIRNTTTITACAYVRNPECEAKEQGYVDARTIKNDEEKARDVLIQQFKWIRGCIDRGREVSALFEMEDKLTELELQVKLMIAEVEGHSGHA